MTAITMIEAVNQALTEEMALDQDVVVLGEDVGRNGGVFRATAGLAEKYGDARCFDTPLSESGIIGSAIGMAVYGLRPVPEIQFSDFIYPAFDQIVSEAAKLRYRSGGEFTCPMTIRTPSGGGIRGGHYHSQSPEAYFCHTPGLKVVMPSTPADAKGLLIASIRDPDPVLFFEPKRLYRSIKQEVPEGAYMIPLGKARTVRAGSDLTLICYGAMVPICEQAAEASDVSVEVIDLRTLVPLDEDAILDSVAKTGRCVVVQEAPRIAGFASEVAAIVAEKRIEYLQAPVLRVTGFDTPFPYALEHVYMPDVRRVLAAIEQAARFE